MKSISQMTSREIAENRAVFGKVHYATVQVRSSTIDIEEFTAARLWQTIGEKFKVKPRVIATGVRILKAEAK